MNIQLEVSKDYLNKDNCLRKANELVSSGQLDMDVQDCAEEIFAHAVIFYGCEKLSKLHMNLTWLKDHANPIDLEDGGDKPERMFAYQVIWEFIPGKK